MSLDNLEQLQAAIADWTDRTDLSARIPLFIRLAEAELNRELRKARRTVQALASLSAPVTALPADCAEVTSLQVRTGPGDAWSDVVPANAANMPADPAAGRPAWFSLVGEGLALAPAPVQAFEARLTYLVKVPALTDAAPSNWVLADHPDAYLNGALVQAFDFLRDPEGEASARAKFDRALAGVLAARRKPAGQLRTEYPAMSRGGSFNIVTG